MAGPMKHGLIAKSREAALSAVQTYNNPLVKFKSETYIVLMAIAWTYLLHAYYARTRVDYRHLSNDPNSKRKYQRTAEGGYRWWDLSACLKSPLNPLDKGTADNLTFLIGLRNEIEHHRPPHLDDHLSARYLACALNYDNYLTAFFGHRYSLGESVAIALQFRDLRPTEASSPPKLPARISRFIENFEAGMTQPEYDDPRFSYRLLFTRKIANKMGQADRAVDFLRPGDPGSEGIDADHWLIKETERPKYRRMDVLAKVRAAGYSISATQHTDLFHELDAKNPAKGYGVMVGGVWYWYDSWIEECKRRCQMRVESSVVVSPLRGS